ncbi:hypothetical protein ASC61_04990 [Aeromicrobium sp. Root344]|nr:hypothetical protein ASC61_04990 [Aeromicrobium sp. Root344]
MCGSHNLANPPTSEDLNESLDIDRDEFAAWTERTRTHVIERSHTATLQRLAGMLDSSSDLSLFDIGAGAGNFLSLARDAGFQPAGNDVSPGAVVLAKERYDIDMHLGDLSVIDDAGKHDAVTMWCVLAHVTDGDQLLSGALEILKPGGVLFLQTPRWSAMDTIGMRLSDLTRGRATRITDRRIAEHHMTLHSTASMRRKLERAGFEIVAIEPRARYSLTTSDYLESLGVPAALRNRLSRMIDTFVERDWFFRNVLDVYARKPS